MRPEIDSFEAGERVSAGKLNTMLAELQRLDNLTVDAPLQLYRGATGAHLMLSAIPRIITAKIDGASSLSPFGTATVNVLRYNDAAAVWDTTGRNVTVTDFFGWTVAANKKLIAINLMDNNLWIPIAAEC